MSKSIRLGSSPFSAKASPGATAGGADRSEAQSPGPSARTLDNILGRTAGESSDPSAPNPPQAGHEPTPDQARTAILLETYHARRTKVSDDKNKIGLEGEMELTRVISLMEDIVSGLKSGTTHFSFGERTLRLTPAPVVRIEISASQKKKEEKIGIKLSWEAMPPLTVKAKS